MTLPTPISPKIQSLITTIKTDIESSQARVYAVIEREKVQTYWTIGKRIKIHVLENEERAEYGTSLMLVLSQELGIVRSTLYRMIKFYELYPSILDASPKLSWTHIRTLLTIENPKERKKLEVKIVSEKLSVKALKTLMKNPPKRQEKDTLSTKREAPYVYTLKEVQGTSRVDIGFKMYLQVENWTLTEAPVTHYTYKAYVIEVIDGDTVWLNIDLGFNAMTTQKVRLRGIDTPEVETLSGMEAKGFVEDALRECPFIAVRTYGRDKFTRYLVDIFYDEDASELGDLVFNGAFLNQDILDEGLGLIYY